MKTANFEFISFTKENLLALTNVREGETKLGEVVQTGFSSAAKYVLIGVQEDIGPQANYGNAGAKNTFQVVLKRFLNMQSNRRLVGGNITCAGYVKQLTEFSTIEQGRKQVEELDDLLIEILTPIFRNNQIPILVGGGHNNAYPLIASFNKAHNKALEVVNCDPHADCRRLEGRHSGNPFSYAREHGFLSFYTILGLHGAYNSENMLNYLNEQGFYYSYFEEYMKMPSKMTADLQTIIIRSDDYLGVELDMDSIKNMPSSAYTPSGIEVEHARLYLMKLASSKRKMAYLHLPEAAPVTEDEEKIVGKTIAYLIHDFVSSCRD
jgi:formiminoglutamase